jgi:hypothetical protein
MNALARWQKAALALSVVGFVALIGGIAIEPTRALTNLLIGAFLVLGLAAGGMAVLCLLTVSNAGWAVVLRRVLEGFGSFLPIAALLILATTPGLRVLYEWARPEAAHDPLLASKAAFLNPTFFLARMVVILGAWLFFTQRLQALSRAQDARDDVALTRAAVRWAAGFIVVFAITVCLAAFDWIMTLEARWFSTIFGFYNIAGILVSTCAAVAIAAVLLNRAGVLPELKPSHLHDVGKLMFAFSTFWAYQWISQFLLIWYSNIPEETVYFEARWENGWLPVFFLNLLVNWALPFLLLLPREAKREPKRLLPVAILLMCGRWLDLWLMTMPGNFSRAPIPGVFEVAGVLGPLGLFAFWVSRRFARVPLIVRNDPYLGESLHHNT